MMRNTSTARRFASAPLKKESVFFFSLRPPARRARRAVRQVTRDTLGGALPRRKRRGFVAGWNKWNTSSRLRGRRSYVYVDKLLPLV